jgi:uncharacterized protein (DUF1800 family)
MRSKSARLLALLICLAVASAAPQLLAKQKEANRDAGPQEQKRAVHALNRLAFGPRPGDVQQVMAMGVDRWIDMQLHPDKLTDKNIDVRLAPLRTLHMSAKEIAEEFPDGQMIRQVMNGRKAMPSDPAKRAIYRVQEARLQAKLDEKKLAAESNPPKSAEPPAADSAKTEEQLAAADASPDAKSSSMQDGMSPASASKDADEQTGMPPTVERKPTPEEEAEARRREERLYADLAIQGLVNLPADDRYKKVMAMAPEDQLAFADSLRAERGQEFLVGLNPKQKETLMALNNPQRVVVEELAQAKLLRAVYSERQLEEVMTDFWFNHFNVFIGKGPERLLVTNYEQNVIRPHALGKFEDLLVATAKSPAMLFYLDNWLSVGPNSMQAQGIPARPVYGRRRRFPPPNAKARRKQSGLNENYGRELLELHTLSVNGGYSQRDVTEVAKVFTGWTIEKPNDGGTFIYDPRKHEPGPKFVLGHHIKAKGEDEGKQVLHVLATSPQTAHFISLKLAQRFVSDDPPPALVDRMAKTFEKKKGDIREVLSTLFHSPEFWDDASYRAKVKTPLEFVASAVRATGAEVEDAMPLARQLNMMGMPLYGAQAPTGYSMKADAWVSSSALLNRMNVALALTSGKIKGLKLDSAQMQGQSGDASAELAEIEIRLLGADVSKQTHDSIFAQISPAAASASPGQDKQPKPPDGNTISGLLLGSPEFQKR